MAEGINIKLNDTEEQISKMEDRAAEITEAEWKKDKKKRNEDSHKRPLRQHEVYQHLNYRGPRRRRERERDREHT